VNMFLATALVTGWGPFPNLGWDGLAIGTATAHSLGGLIILGMLLRGRTGMKLVLGWPRPDGEMIRRILRTGFLGRFDAASAVATRGLRWSSRLWAWSASASRCPAFWRGRRFRCRFWASRYQGWALAWKGPGWR